MCASNKEKKEVLISAFAEMVNQVLPDDEVKVITKAEALAVLEPADILAVVGSALGIGVSAPAPAVEEPAVNPVEV